MSDEFPVRHRIETRQCDEPMSFILVAELISRTTSIRHTAPRKIVYADDIATNAEHRE